MRSRYSNLKKYKPFLLYHDRLGRFFWYANKWGQRTFNCYMTRRTVDPEMHESEVMDDDELVHAPVEGEYITLRNYITNERLGTFQVDSYPDIPKRGERGFTIYMRPISGPGRQFRWYPTFYPTEEPIVEIDLGTLPDAIVEVPTTVGPTVIIEVPFTPVPVTVEETPPPISFTPAEPTIGPILRPPRPRVPSPPPPVRRPRVPSPIPSPSPSPPLPQPRAPLVEEDEMVVSEEKPLTVQEPSPDAIAIVQDQKKRLYEFTIADVQEMLHSMALKKIQMWSGRPLEEQIMWPAQALANSRALPAFYVIQSAEFLYLKGFQPLRVARKQLRITPGIISEPLSSLLADDIFLYLNPTDFDTIGGDIEDKVIRQTYSLIQGDTHQIILFLFGRGRIMARVITATALENGEVEATNVPDGNTLLILATAVDPDSIANKTVLPLWNKMGTRRVLTLQLGDTNALYDFSDPGTGLLPFDIVSLTLIIGKEPTQNTRIEETGVFTYEVINLLTIYNGRRGKESIATDFVLNLYNQNAVALLKDAMIVGSVGKTAIENFGGSIWVFVRDENAHVFVGVATNFRFNRIE